MTVCNMSIEGGARLGYVNPDATTFEYLRGRQFAPAADDCDRAVAWWKSMASDADARYDDTVALDGSSIAPTVTWGINPGQAVGVDEEIPSPEMFPADERAVADDAYEYMGFKPGAPLRGTRIDVAFIGSCTNGRLSDLREWGMSPPTSRPWWCRDRRPWPRLPRPKAWTKCSVRPVSSGACQAAPCAWR